MNTCILDIETTGLEAQGAGVLLCAVIKPYQKPSKTFRIDRAHCRPGREAPLLRQVVDELGKYNLIVGHNVDKFDLPFLRSRCLILGVDWRLRPFTYDTMRAFKRTGLRTVLNSWGKPSAGLAMVVDFFGIKQQKTAIHPREWWQSVWGDSKQRQLALIEITSHCRKDVAMNEKLYHILLDLDTKAIVRKLA